MNERLLDKNHLYGKICNNLSLNMQQCENEILIEQTKIQSYHGEICICFAKACGKFSVRCTIYSCNHIKITLDI